MSTDNQIRDLLDVLQYHPGAKLDCLTLIHGYSATAMMLARSSNPVSRKWELIEEQRIILRKALVGLCGSYKVELPESCRQPAEGVTDGNG